MSQILSMNSGGGGGGFVTTLTGNDLVPVIPVAGNINVIGNGVDVSTSGAGNTLTIAVTGGGGGGITTIDGDGSTSVTGSTITLTGGTSGAVFTGSGTTMTESFNFLSLPTTSSTVGQILINAVPALHMFGTNNIFVGGAGSFNLSGNGHECSAVGLGAMAAATTSQYSCAFGFQSLNANISSSFNSAYGVYSLCKVTGGADDNGANTAMGYGALKYIVAAKLNVGIGYNCGSAYTSTESSNIVIGNDGVIAESNIIRIGTSGSGEGQQNACYVAGINGISVTGSPVLVSTSDQLGITVSSRKFKDNIQDMGNFSSPLMQLRPRTFTYKIGTDKSVQPGLIAEEVEAIMPSLVAYDKEGAPFSVNYHTMVTMLLNEVQKLNARIVALEAKKA